MQGKYAYIGVGQRLTILDVSDPAKFLGMRLDRALRVVCGGHAIAGGIAYVAVGGAGLYAGMLVAKVGDPIKPSAVGSLDTPGDTYGVAVLSKCGTDILMLASESLLRKASA